MAGYDQFVMAARPARRICLGNGGIHRQLAMSTHRGIAVQPQEKSCKGFLSPIDVSHLCRLAGLLYAFLLLACLPVPVQAAWPAAGVRICQGDSCTGMNGLFPFEDGTGGVVFTWDRLTGAAGLSAQRIRPDGSIASGWPSNGRVINSIPWVTTNRASCPDGAGGTFFVWTDQRPSDVVGEIYAMHLDAYSNPAPGWPLNGLRLTNAPDLQNVGYAWTTWTAGCIPDGTGGFYAAWYDYRDAAQSSADIYAHRIRADGTPYPGWPTNGLPVCTAALSQSNPLLTSDTQGGVFITWDDEREGLYMQRLNADGTIAAGFTPNGKLVFAAPGTRLHSFNVSMEPDGQGGLFYFAAILDEYSNFIPYVTRIQPDGSVAPGWSRNGLPLPVAEPFLLLQDDPHLARDGQGGVYVSWTDFRTNSADAYLQHFRSDGRAPGFAADGLLISGGPGYQDGTKLVSDGAGGVYMTHADTRLGREQVIAHHRRGDGTPAPGWSLQGVAVGDNGVNSVETRGIVSDGAGGAYAAWYTRAQIGSVMRLVPDGVVATLASLVSSEATADRVHLEWSSMLGAATRFVVERRDSDSPDWQALGDATVENGDRVVFDDTQVRIGARYVYRLRYTANGAATTSAEAWVQIPNIAAFALMGAVPNPALAGDLRVRFSVPESGAVKLSLVDLNGRRVHEQTEHTRTIGVHDVRLAANAAMRPGLYWLVMEHGARRATTRVTVVR